MLHNKWDLPVSTSSPECVELLDLFVSDFLAYGNRAGKHVTDAVAADPHCALANVFATSLFMFAEMPTAPEKCREFMQQAAKSIADARDANAPVSEREQWWFEAVQAWSHARNLDRAVEMLRRVAAAYPRDIYAVKLCQNLYFMRGDVQGQLDVIRSVYHGANTRERYVHGMYAFALVETEQYEQAEIYGKEGQSLGDDPWAQHAVCHVYDCTGQIDRGASWMESHSNSWSECNSFMYTHNWWHLALFYLDREQSSDVLKLFDERVWGVYKDSSEDQMGATSLLWRCELRQVDVADRWLDLSDYIAPRVREHLHPIIDMHYAYALARSGKTERLQEFLASLEEQNGGEWCQRNQCQLVVPAVRGIASYAMGDYDHAYELLAPVMRDLKQLGGSDAQQDVFRQTYLDTLIRTARWSEAQPRVETIASVKPIPFWLRQRDRVRQGLLVS